MNREIITDEEFPDLLKKVVGPTKAKLLQMYKVNKKLKMFLVLKAHFTNMSEAIIVNPKIYKKDGPFKTRYKRAIIQMPMKRKFHYILGNDDVLNLIRGPNEEKRVVETKSDFTKVSQSRKRSDLPVQKILQKLQQRPDRSTQKLGKRTKKTI